MQRDSPRVHDLSVTPGQAQPMRRFRVYAPTARSVHFLHSCRSETSHTDVALRHESIREGEWWTVEVEAGDGDEYWWEVDGVGPLLDPSAWEIRRAGSEWVNVVRSSWPAGDRLPGGAPAEPVVYELHVKGFGGGFDGSIAHLDHVRDLGVDVIELMPVHPFDDSTNYWGYMPLVWGAVHTPFGSPEALARLVAAAHERGLAVWLDVVFNHTGEGDATMPTRSLRGLCDATAYRHRPDGSYTDDSGCGNDIDPADPYVRHLLMEALQRFADLGVDGFRFDLASLLTRDGGGLVELITDWGVAHGITLVAEPWDLAAYQVGEAQWPEPWLQWNDRFRDDVRGFVRGEPGLVGAVADRLRGSPDLFGAAGAARTLNFVTAHDGLTLHDLTTVTSDRHRSWDCGAGLRLQQLKNYLTLLLLARGAAMFVMGDEAGRTQHGFDNPFDIDSQLTWMDWSRVAGFDELSDFTRSLIGLRRRRGGGQLRCFGVGHEVDLTHDSRSIAWHDGGLYVMANMWWEPLTFEVHVPGTWRPLLWSAPPEGTTVQPRSVVVLGVD
jgi:isoamylase